MITIRDTQENIYINSKVRTIVVAAPVEFLDPFDNVAYCMTIICKTEDGMNITLNLTANRKESLCMLTIK